MVETKKISELSVLEQVTDQTYLLVEQDGETCRLPISVLSEHLGTTGGNEEGGLITFTIDDAYGQVEYQAVKGMTWREWVDSEYNTTNDVDENGDCMRPEIYFYNDHLVCEDMLYQNENGDFLPADDTINEGVTLSLSPISALDGIPNVKFTIDGTTYRTVEGMTWEDWLACPLAYQFERDIYYDFDTSVYYYADSDEEIKVYLLDESGERVQPTDVMESGHAYRFSYSNPFTFFIGDTECQATENMTWSEWLDSTFNNYSTPITIVDDGLYAQEWDSYLYFENEGRAYGDTVIASGHSYYWA